MQLIEPLRIIAVLLLCGATSYNDLRTGLISDKITLPAIALGLLLNAVEFIQNIELLATALLVAAAVFLSGYGLYYAGKIGGGDVKLFVAVALLMPFFGGGVFVLPVVFYSVAAASVALSCYYVTKYVRSGIEWKENIAGIARALLFGIPIIFYITALSTMGVLNSALAFVWFVPVVFGLFFLAFEYGIRKKFFLKEVAANELEEDDVIAVEFMSPKDRKWLGLGLRGVIGKKEIEKLKKMKVKKIKVYRDMPRFAPFVLAGVAFALAFPDFFNSMFAVA